METRAYKKVCIGNNNIYLKKNVDMGRTTEQTFLGFFAVVFMLVGHYPYYMNPDCSIIKSFSAFVFPLWFFPWSSTQKYWCLCMHDVVSSFSSIIFI
jgi:hypothetical protein